MCSLWHELANGGLKFKRLVSLSSLKVAAKPFATFRYSPASPTQITCVAVRKIVGMPSSEMLCIVSRNPEEEQLLNDPNMKGAT